ncbi:hypothetical protein [Phenylobacterium sp.]|uniref:hypothetical protein n=1 Tax=Phenylobacterium sp. TaxID=1871053 RepID=UPI002F401302
MMRKLLIGGMAALSFATAIAPATGAMARDHRHYRGRHDDDGAAIAAGIAGLAIGAALASGGGRRDYGRYDYDGRGYYRESYDDGYYRPYYGHRYYRPYAYSYSRCRTTTNWDPWEEAYVRRTRCW